MSLLLLLHRPSARRKPSSNSNASSCGKTSTATSFGSCNSPMTSSSQYTPNRLATIVFITKSFDYSRRRGASSSSMSFVVALPFVDAFVVVDSDSSAVVSHRVFFRIASVEPSSSPPSPLGPSSSVLFVPPNRHNSTNGNDRFFLLASCGCCNTTMRQLRISECNGASGSAGHMHVRSGYSQPRQKGRLWWVPFDILVSRPSG